MILETQRLYLRHFTIDDAQRLSEYRNKKEVAQFQTWKKYTYRDARKRIEHCIKHPDIEERGNNQFAIILKDNDKLIGDLFVETNKTKSFVLGYTLDSAYWSKGYASEIVLAFFEYMKETYHFQKVICYVYKDNERSQHLLKKLGFKKFSESYFYDDEGYVKVL